MSWFCLWAGRRNTDVRWHSGLPCSPYDVAVQIRAFERWLDDGWSPWGIGYGITTLVATAVSVYGYVSHPHHPGAVWWLLAAVAPVAVWALLEALRWRIRYKRLIDSISAVVHNSQPASDPAAIIKTVIAKNEANRIRGQRRLLGEGRILQSRISTAFHHNRYLPAALVPELTKWQVEVGETLEDSPGDLKAFEDQSLSGFPASELPPDAAFMMLEHQLELLNKVVKRKALPAPSSKTDAL